MKQHINLFRVIALVLAMILCLGAVASCGGDTPDTPDTPETPDTPPADDPGQPPVEEPDDPGQMDWPDDGETVTVDNLAEYTVLRSENAEGDVRTEVSAMYMFLMNKHIYARK